jgi:isocitrate/isopropylmalate dehydrogenase
MFEPIHGSAPKYSKQDKVNPIAAVISARMMCDWLARRHGDARLGEVSKAIEAAVVEVLAEGRALTYDLGGSARCSEVGAALAAAARKA